MLSLIKNNRPIGALKTNDRGAMVVEFAILAPVFLIFLIGIIDMGRMLWVQSSLQFTVEQTARYAMVNKTATMMELETYATSSSRVGTGATFVAINSEVSGISYRTITAQYPFQFMIPIIPIGNINIVAKSSTPVSHI